MEENRAEALMKIEVGLKGYSSHTKVWEVKTLFYNWDLVLLSAQSWAWG